MSPIKWRAGMVSKFLVHKGLIDPRDVHAPCHKKDIPEGCASVSVAGITNPSVAITIHFKSHGDKRPLANGTFYETFRYYRVMCIISKTNQHPDRIYMGSGYFDYLGFATTLTELDMIIKSVAGLVRQAL